MPRHARFPPGDWRFTFSIEAWGGCGFFAKDADYAAFERVLADTLAAVPMRICAYLIMPNHWHMVL
jgi:hypothetical protein